MMPSTYHPDSAWPWPIPGCQPPVPEQLRAVGDDRALGWWWDAVSKGTPAERRESAEALLYLIDTDPKAALAEVREHLPCPCVDPDWFEECDGEAAVLRRCVELLRAIPRSCPTQRTPLVHYLDVIDTLRDVLSDVAETVDRTVIVTVCAFCQQFISARSDAGNGEHFSVSHSHCDACHEIYMRAATKSTCARAPTGARGRMRRDDVF
jgi:hypothetical protein